MRYEVRWCNGLWGTFDSEQYRTTKTHSLKSEAQEDVDKRNR